MEHVTIVNSLKPSTTRNTRAQLEDKLQRVRLLTNANDFSSSFSGGMKRRLSFTLATIGDPKILFLDEPVCAHRIGYWCCCAILTRCAAL
jgi:ABC-type multidrug transport system ATPase subunit